MTEPAARYQPAQVDVPRLLRLLGVRAEQDGDRWLARCPSGRHEDRKPSWRIRDARGSARNALHHCWSCLFGSTAIDLVQHVLGLTTASAAAEWIIENAQGEAPAALELEVRFADRVRFPFALPAGAEFGPLASWPTPARRYAEQRGITDQQVDRWGLGYAVEGRLRGRLVIPIRDRWGVLLSYTARSFAGQPKRYLNPAEQEGPEPGAVFGEEHWPGGDDPDLVVVLEGALNALAVERVAPLLPVAALGGSRHDPLQVAKLARFRRAVLFTDADPAGDGAASRLIASLARHLSLARALLPPGQDPASAPPEALAGALDGALCQMGSSLSAHGVR